MFNENYSKLMFKASEITASDKKNNSPWFQTQMFVCFQIVVVDQVVVVVAVDQVDQVVVVVVVVDQDDQVVVVEEVDQGVRQS